MTNPKSADDVGVSNDPTSAVPGPAPSRRGLLEVVALAGAGTMVVELAAIRVLAPWFGTSSTVWTNVIGVVLLAMSLGYLTGSRLALRPRPMAALSSCLLFAAALTVWIPLGADPVAQYFLPAGITLDRAAGLMVWGSLATSLILFAPPALALGCIGPLAMECLQKDGVSHAGTAGGRVLFASTLGSLVGTFGTTHFLIPMMGLVGTLYLAAGVLALLGLGIRLKDRKASAGLYLASLLGVSALVIPSHSVERLGDDAHLLASAQSTYQSLRVVEFGTGESRTRQLQVNEGFDSFQSVWQPQTGLLPSGYYYNFFCPPAWWAGATEHWNTLVLGLGAGTTWRVLDGTLPPGLQMHATGIEIDAKAIELARRWMDMPPESPDRRVLDGWDARAGLSQLQGRFNEIVLDTYANQMEIPPHLCSLEFFEEVNEALAVGGFLAVNIGGFGFDDPVVSTLANTAARAFGSPALVVRVPFSRNYVAYLRRGAPLPMPGSEEWAVGPEGLQALLKPVAIEGAWQVFDGTGEVLLTDNRSDMEQLQRASIELRAAKLAEQEQTL